MLFSMLLTKKEMKPEDLLRHYTPSPLGTKNRDRIKVRDSLIDTLVDTESSIEDKLEAIAAAATELEGDGSKELLAIVRAIYHILSLKHQAARPRSLTNSIEEMTYFHQLEWIKKIRTIIKPDHSGEIDAKDLNFAIQDSEIRRWRELPSLLDKAHQAFTYEEFNCEEAQANLLNIARTLLLKIKSLPELKEPFFELLEFLIDKNNTAFNYCRWLLEMARYRQDHPTNTSTGRLFQRHTQQRFLDAEQYTPALLKEAADLNEELYPKLSHLQVHFGDLTHRRHFEPSYQKSLDWKKNLY